MSLVACLRSARRNWYLLLICALVAAGASLYLTHREQREYRSSIRLAVGPSPKITRQTRIAQTVDSLNKRSLITTFAEIVAGRQIYREAVAAAGIPPEEARRYAVSSNALPEANVIALDVQGPRGIVAERLVTAIGARSIVYIEDFYKNFAVRELDNPETPSDPVKPTPKRDVPLAAAGGLAFGFFLGLCRDYLRERRRRESRDDVALER
jgi:capsular polysaccharide biosynthesis protein